MIELIVYGTPGPQGSKSFMGVTAKGRGKMVESSKKVKPWRAAVEIAFRQRYGTGKIPTVSGPVTFEAVFYLARPKAAKGRPFPSVKPDLSKLIRSTEDALTKAGAWEDDARVVNITSGKRYVGGVNGLAEPGTRIRIREAA